MHQSSRVRVLAMSASLAGLFASAALSAPYVGGAHLCAVGGGCGKVAESAQAMVFGVPRALVGLFAFAMAWAVSSGAWNPPRWLGRVIGGVAAIEGVRLLLTQVFVIHAICPWCVVADVSATVLGAVLASGALQRPILADETRRRFLRWSVALGAAAIALPLAYSIANKPRTVMAIATHEAPRSSVVIREWMDLECPFCRATHAEMRAALRGREDVVLERHHVPLPQHTHARVAAEASCCAAEQGAEERFVDAVVATQEEPDAARCRAFAAQIGLDLPRFDACVKSGRASARIDGDLKRASDEHIEALPTIDVIGPASKAGTRHVGAIRKDEILALVSNAQRTVLQSSSP